MDTFIKSPLNYIGGKSKILNQILPLFPNKIGTFVDLFAGGCNVGINVSAKKVRFNDNLSYVIDMFKAFVNNKCSDILEYIEKRIKSLNLTLDNTKGYNELREIYNTEKTPLDLFVLIAYSFNHQIRFNNSHKFNVPFGNGRSSFNVKMKQNLINFIEKLQTTDCKFTAECFTDIDFSILKKNDYVYCDPPYLITLGTYNDGKRGFKGWTEKEETQLLTLLNELDRRNIRFGLSNVINHKGKTNLLLKNRIEENPKFSVHYINHNYSNSNYQTIIRDKNATTEIFVTNYKS